MAGTQFNKAIEVMSVVCDPFRTFCFGIKQWKRQAYYWDYATRYRQSTLFMFLYCNCLGSHLFRYGGERQPWWTDIAQRKVWIASLGHTFRPFGTYGIRTRRPCLQTNKSQAAGAGVMSACRLLFAVCRLPLACRIVETIYILTLEYVRSYGNDIRCSFLFVRWNWKYYNKIETQASKKWHCGAQSIDAFIGRQDGARSRDHWAWLTDNKERSTEDIDRGLFVLFLILFCRMKIKSKHKQQKVALRWSTIAFIGRQEGTMSTEQGALIADHWAGRTEHWALPLKKANAIAIAPPSVVVDTKWRAAVDSIPSRPKSGRS